MEIKVFNPRFRRVIHSGKFNMAEMKDVSGNSIYNEMPSVDSTKTAQCRMKTLRDVMKKTVNSFTKNLR